MSSANVVVVGEMISRPVNASTAKYLRIRSSGGKWYICGAADRCDGISIEAQTTTGGYMSGQLISPGRVFRMLANATIAVDDPIWGDASGKVTNTYTVGAEFLGFAQTAAVAGGIVEVLNRALRMVEGQKTTVTASDTIVTGLAQVLTVVASFDSDPVDNPEFVSASIGDQAGTPAAGSILLKTWQNTGGNDPTPTAATTFGKKVNWVAWGY